MSYVGSGTGEYIQETGGDEHFFIGDDVEEVYDFDLSERLLDEVPGEVDEEPMPHGQAPQQPVLCHCGVCHEKDRGYQHIGLHRGPEGHEDEHQVLGSNPLRWKGYQGEHAHSDRWQEEGLREVDPGLRRAGRDEPHRHRLNSGEIDDADDEKLYWLWPFLEVVGKARAQEMQEAEEIFINRFYTYSGVPIWLGEEDEGDEGDDSEGDEESSASTWRSS